MEVHPDNHYENFPYHLVEPEVSVIGFGLNQGDPHSTHHGCEVSSVTCGASYHEVMAPYQKLDMDTEPEYSHTSGTQQGSRLPNTSLPALMNFPDHMNQTIGCHGSHKPHHSCHSAGLLLGNKQHVANDDFESDSGLSLGSSPPLASPEGRATGVPAAYISLDPGLPYGESEREGKGVHCRMRENMNHPTEYQLNSFCHYPRATSTYFPVTSSLSLQPQHAPQPIGLYAHREVLSGSYEHDLNCDISSSRPNDSTRCLNLYSKQLGSNPSIPLSRDERRAVALKIPLPLEKIVNLPVDDFNELLTQHTLSDAQLALVRDIRRRGKNKVAAQNCRRRKLENIQHLEGELGQLRAQRELLVHQHMDHQRSLAIIKCRLSELYTRLFSQLRDEKGLPYSFDDYFLEQTNDGNVYLIPRSRPTSLEKA